MYIQANLIGSVLPPIKLKGIFIEEELNIHPALICFKPNSKPITKTKNDIINKNNKNKGRNQGFFKFSPISIPNSAACFISLEDLQ